MSCVAIVAVLLISFRMITIIRSLRAEVTEHNDKEIRTQQTADFTKKHANFRVFYETFRDSDLTQQSFFFIFTMRLIVYYTVIAALFYSPLAQTILILLMSVFMVLYLFIRYPVKDKLKLSQYIIQEILILIVNVCVMIVAGLDHAGVEAYSTKKALGDIFTYCNMILSMLSPFYIVMFIIAKVMSLISTKRPVPPIRLHVVNRNMSVTSQAPVIARDSHGKTKIAVSEEPQNESDLVLVQNVLDQSQSHSQSQTQAHSQPRLQISDSLVRSHNFNFVPRREELRIDNPRNPIVELGGGYHEYYTTADKLRKLYKTRLDRSKAHEPENLMRPNQMNSYNTRGAHNSPEYVQGDEIAPSREEDNYVNRLNYDNQSRVINRPKIKRPRKEMSNQ